MKKLTESRKRFLEKNIQTIKNKKNDKSVSKLRRERLEKEILAEVDIMQGGKTEKVKTLSILHKISESFIWKLLKSKSK
jgi:hypothetical protein